MKSEAASNGHALVVSYSDIVSDPRVRRQIDWLSEAGWSVDSLGLSSVTPPRVRDHFPIGDPSRWLVTGVGTAIAHRLLPARVRFRRLLLDRVPNELRDRIRSGRYELIVFNEFEFLPWVADTRDFTPAARNAQLHLDIHEYRNPVHRRPTLGGRITANHYRWMRSFIGNPAFDTRTVVNAPIGALYQEEFGFDEPVVVRNTPGYVDQAPSSIRPDEIRLLFHGMPGRARGFDQILDAMRVLPDRFTMTFMLMPNAEVRRWLDEQLAAHPARSRINIVPPAPMREISQRINPYDLEIIFYRPLGRNLEFALPNKFFEAIQGRLGLVVGESPLMAEIVRRYGNGVVVPGFEAEDLVESLRNLTPERVMEFKRASGTAARELNAEVEGRRFISALEGGRT